ncbi:vegetative cell wall protein gp1-like [Piliocolobus tephrosceles]|uniref:vegetative cell wall protein gp1-like n=1 Tax=Piliocolobus tephrosceles TaxID=591936 RepID=UPI001300F0EC|nr:vegetative cell wall protein gp1-like [Piliocolobus tephrosceles]
MHKLRMHRDSDSGDSLSSGQDLPASLSPAKNKSRKCSVGCPLVGRKSEDVSNTEANPGSPGASVVVAFKSGSSPRLSAGSQAHSPQTDLRRGAQARPSALRQRESCVQRRLGGCSQAGWCALWGRPWSLQRSQAGKWGQGVGADTPPAVPPAPGRGRRPAGPRPAARRAGPLAQARCRGRRIRAALPLARPASFLPAEPRASRGWPPPPSPLLPSRSCPTRALPGGVLPGRGPAPPSGPYPGPPSLPLQPVSGRRSPLGVEREEPRGPDRASGAAPRSQRDVPKSNLSGGSRKRNSAGSAPATLFPPPDSLPPPSPAFLPSATRALRPSPCLCLAVRPPLASHSYLFVPHPLGTPVPLPSPRPHGPSRRPLMPPAAGWPGPQCPKRGFEFSQEPLSEPKWEGSARGTYCPAAPRTHLLIPSRPSVELRVGGGWSLEEEDPYGPGP